MSTPFLPEGGTDVPAAPIDIPVPDIPPANFREAGGQLATGAKEAGFWSGLWDGLTSIIPSILAKIVGFLFGVFGVIVAWILARFAEARQTGAFGVKDAAAATVSDLFDVQVSPGSIGAGAGWEARQGWGGNIADKILSGIGAGAPTSGANSIPPSSDGAKHFLSTMVNLSVEGWLEGFLFELISAGQVETFAELKDILAQSMGLGRMAHNALRPAIRIFIRQPYERLLNQTYLPTLLSVGELVRLYIEGRMTRQELDAAAALLGYSSDKVTLLIDVHRTHVSGAQLGSLIDHGNITEADALRELNAQGYDNQTAGWILFLERKSRPEAILRTAIDSAIAGFAAGKIDADEMGKIITCSALPETEKAAYNQLASLHRELHKTRPSLAQGQQLVEAGLWTLDQFRELALYYGYSDQDELDLELLLLGKIKSQADAAAKKAAAAASKAAAAQQKLATAAAKAATAAAAAEAKGVSTAKYEALVVAGLKTMADYTAFLTARRVAPDNITALTAALQSKLDKQGQAAGVAAGAAAQLKQKNLSQAQLERAVKDGVITMQEYVARLESAGVAAADAAILATVLQDAIDAAKTSSTAAAALKGSAKGKKLSLAQFELAVREGLRTIDSYTVFLQGNGYAADDVATLVGELGAQLAKDKAAASTKATVTGTAKQRGLNLAELEKAVRAGVKTIADYQAAVAALGYDTDAQAALVSLLQLRLDQDQATAVASSSAAKALGKIGIPLGDLERAVKLALVPLSTLVDAMTRAGVNSEDAQLVQLYVTAEAAAAASAKAKTDTAATLVAKQGVSLASLEKDAVAGRITVAQLTAQLAAAGVSSEDQSAIAQLVQDEIDNAAAVAAQETAAGAKAATKGLSLAEFKAAVRQGVKTLADYQAFLIALGYDTAAAAVLVGTLASEIGQPQP